MQSHDYQVGVVVVVVIAKPQPPSFFIPQPDLVPLVLVILIGGIFPPPLFLGKKVIHQHCFAVGEKGPEKIA